MKFILFFAVAVVLLFIGMGLAWQISKKEEVRSFDESVIGESIATSEVGQSITRETTVTNSNRSTTTRVEVAGVTILLPVEKKNPAKVMTSTISADGKYSYSSSSVNLNIDGGKLTVEGKDYGALKAGNEVDLRNKGTVLVNGAERKAVAP